jgi:hypothetical protein
MTVFSATASIPLLVLRPTPCNWRNDQHSELHDDGSASGARSLESGQRGTAVKGASVQRTSGFRLARRVLGNDHPHLGYPTPLTWLEVKLPAELEDPWVKGGSDLAKVTCAEAAADGVEFGMVPCVESFYAKLKFAASVFAEDEALE